MARPTPAIATWTGLAALAAALALPATGTAYQRTETCDESGIYACEPGERPKPVSWPVRCVRYEINRRGAAEFDQNGDRQIDPEAREYIRDAFEAWNRPDCSDFTLVESGLTRQSRAEFDRSADWSENTNLVVFRESKWPYTGGHSFALTSVTYDSETGRIADADIELNAAEETFAYFESSRVGRTRKVDLGNALTHEVGHLIGLDHADVDDATMYASAAAGEIKKRTLHEDDIRGLCAAYPARAEGPQCDEPADFVPNDVRQPSGSVCSTSGERGAPAGVALCIVLLWALATGRRRRGRC